jgi:hypothetical protein
MLDEVTEMIVERITFQAKYGHGDELVALMKETPAGSSGPFKGRLYTDLTGPMFTVQFEVEHPDLAAFAASEAELRKDYGTSEFEQWFARMVAVTEKGERQLLNLETVG